MSLAKASSVYAPSRHSTINHMNVREIASALRRLGISQDTIFIEYHTNRRDLQILRELFVSEAYDNILPPDRNCILLINILRPNKFKDIPKEQRSPLALEFLFPLMYPRHYLIGLNHQALVGYRQARLVCKAFAGLCKPVEERGETWQATTVVTSSTAMLIQGDIITSWTWWRSRFGLGSFKAITPWVPKGLYPSLEGERLVRNLLLRLVNSIRVDASLATWL
ncbi:hypothetical protein F5B21DRAFT_160450 [Xylaria acuta]|nr:hypothetical protein F5B21DRAFT_160450 [Xylaria acuta]